MTSTEEQHSQTNTMPYHLWHNSMTSNLTIGGQTSVLVTSIGCLVVVNTYLKMLHETIKKLLNIVLIHNILTSGIVAALMTYMITTHAQDFMICSIWLMAGSNAFVTRFGMALMSFSRYHITWKISKCESTKKISKHMVIAMVVYGIFDYFILGPLSFFAAIHFDIPTAALSCAGGNTQGLPILPAFHITKTLIIIIFGITYDILIMKFLRKRNAQKEPGQSKLVVWKSGDRDHDLLVPVSATVTSVIACICSLGIAFMIMKGYLENDEESWKYVAFSASVMTNIDMIVMIGLTIRAAKLRKPKPKIPRRPMYYDNIIDPCMSRVDIIQFLTKGHKRHYSETSDSNQDVKQEGSSENHHELSQRNNDSRPKSRPTSPSNNHNLINVKPIIKQDTECHI